MSLFLSKEKASLAHNWIVQNVLGTCQFESQHIHDFGEYMKELGLVFNEEDLEAAFHNAMNDAEVQECVGCGWYVESYECNERGMCSDCEPSEDKD